MNKTCENCRWVPDWRESKDFEYGQYGVCKYPAELKYIGNPRIFIENEFTTGRETLRDNDGNWMHNSVLPCPKWEEPAKKIKRPPTVEHVRDI